MKTKTKRQQYQGALLEFEKRAKDQALQKLTPHTQDMIRRALIAKASPGTMVGSLVGIVLVILLASVFLSFAARGAWWLIQGSWS